MRLLGTLAAAVIAILAMAVATFASLHSSRAANDSVTHARQLREALDEALVMALNAETGERGFMITGQEEYLEPYNAGIAHLGPALDRVQELIRDDAEQQRQLSEMRKVLAELLAVLTRGVEARQHGDDAEVRAIVASGRGKQLMDRARVLLSQMVDEETRSLGAREREWMVQERRSALIVLVGAAFLLVLSIVAALVVRGDLRRREQIARDRARVYEYQERLTNIVSHDVRNPLSAIKASLGLLLRKREALSPEHVAALERAQQSTARIDSLSALLVDYTHARLGRGLPTTLAPADARVAVQRAIDEFLASSPSSAITLEHRTENLRGVWDAERLTQLTSNLVSNALRYGRSNAAVTVTLADGPQDTLEIRVHNEGAAIPKELLPTLFEPYKRGDGALKSGRRGLGLGLYIVREIVRAHAGEIEVRSDEGTGTTFSARLPRHPPAPAAKPATVEPTRMSDDTSGIIVRLSAARPA